MKEKKTPDKFREACGKVRSYEPRTLAIPSPRAVPRGHRPIQSVWSMKRKRIPGTRRELQTQGFDCGA
jgi:hypothetical protein